MKIYYKKTKNKKDGLIELENFFYLKKGKKYIEIEQCVEEYVCFILLLRERGGGALSYKMFKDWLKD